MQFFESWAEVTGDGGWDSSDRSGMSTSRLVNFVPLYCRVYGPSYGVFFRAHAIYLEEKVTEGKVVHYCSLMELIGRTIIRCC